MSISLFMYGALVSTDVTVCALASDDDDDADDDDDHNNDDDDDAGICTPDGRLAG